MRARFNKSKGATLIEVLVSIAIFSIISIPLSMTVISAIENNKKGSNEQYAVASAQQIIEGLRVNNITIPNSVTIKADTKTNYDLKFISSAPGNGHDLSYSALDQNIGKGFKANVTFERKLSYKGATTTTTTTKVNYDLIIQMDEDSIRVTGTNSSGITGDKSYNITDDLIICNNSNNTIQLQKKNSTKDIIGTYKTFNTITDALIDNIKISYLPNYGPHEIQLENNATDPLSVYIFKQDSEKENTYTNSKGSIKFYDNLSSTAVISDNTNGIYDISVDIYKGEDPNEVKVYSTKTSISLGT
ncbi:prepilin-type N-terminal cleavage/methylation domain-containing protein [Clostridium estertheticum]|uniref:prepilin-type N-terminal cleavage/methylation domain-containing protein n=1 Tax=Clostridium estertheticum TaxID=238834 RepID=UPI001C0B6991|nr:prepilin-type N-terminal cleavage/methylation domain-containing protein [Clostridium estertheticum]MBU3198426.1 prepilin-type N-terminal cleavage/methylation domain-containing protein [Clostridium estertheticum]WAG65107.1 prepilin-type N-terminal cleavage/methylation domain-containing protein [Clostridium estertheticum]